MQITEKKETSKFEIKWQQSSESRPDCSAFCKNYPQIEWKMLVGFISLELNMVMSGSLFFVSTISVLLQLKLLTDHRFLSSPFFYYLYLCASQFFRGP